MHIKNYMEALLNMGLFKDFTAKKLSELFNKNNHHIKEYKKNKIIHFQNEMCNTMDIILMGQVSVQKIDGNGNILTVSTFSSSDIMGVNLLFSNRNYYPMTITAKSNTIILHIHKEFIIELCQNNSNFLISLITAISNNTLTLTDKINSISLKTIRQSIIEFLKYEYHIQKSIIIKLNLSKKEMAERLGVQRSSFSRELNKMKKDGLLDYNAKTITIKNMDMILGKN